jgi:hypothetical protein
MIAMHSILDLLFPRPQTMSQTHVLREQDTSDVGAEVRPFAADDQHPKLKSAEQQKAGG